MESGSTNLFLSLFCSILSDALLWKILSWANLPFPAICVVEISGAVCQGLSGFNALLLRIWVIIIRKLFRTKILVFSLKALVAPTPPQIFGYSKKYFTVFKDLAFSSFLFLYVSPRLLHITFFLIVSLWFIQIHSRASRLMGLRHGPNSIRTSSSQSLLVITMLISRF
jgi:hypothetical protein